MAEMAVLNNVMATSAKKRKPGFIVFTFLSVVNKTTAKALVKYVAAPLAFWMVSRGMAQATDLAAAGKADVEATFGEDSTMMYYIMMAEVILVFLLYFRNHNPATFLLIPVFIVVTKVVFSMIAP